uniref:40S ribosomal protein S24 n=2 Tax=Craspedostauros australis TaxID=1486917 RepID=A0A7R9ZQT9_9STRA|mmetsp:Transcript_6245/g.16960  ORF Transcript_6245/g.16960 Transcript_6245/m.16960 type:complete len:137 (+) Transcript_6245:121-531(+)
MSDSTVLIKTRKFKRNPLLARKQMIIDVIHPGRANVAKSELCELLAGMYKSDAKLTTVFGFKTAFGGGKSTGFCLIYDDEDSMLKFEPKYRLVRKGAIKAKEYSRKAIKEAKNKRLKIRGTGASIAKHKAKRAGDD